MTPEQKQTLIETVQATVETVTGDKDVELVLIYVTGGRVYNTGNVNPARFADLLIQGLEFLSQATPALETITVEVGKQGN